MRETNVLLSNLESHVIQSIIYLQHNKSANKEQDVRHNASDPIKM